MTKETFVAVGDPEQSISCARIVGQALDGTGRMVEHRFGAFLAPVRNHEYAGGKLQLAGRCKEQTNG